MVKEKVIMNYNFSKFYKNKKILITGATGFKGAWLCSLLLKMGAKVYGAGFTPNKNKHLFYKHIVPLVSLL